MNADITKLAMGGLYHRLKPFNARLINVVHNKLVFEVPKEDAEKAVSIIRYEMEATGREYVIDVPVIVEVNGGEHGKSKVFLFRTEIFPACTF